MRLLVLLIQKVDETWFELRSARGTNPDDIGAGHFTFTVLMRRIKTLIQRAKDDHEKHTRS